MKKYIDFIAVFLLLIFVFTSCAEKYADDKNGVSRKNFVGDDIIIDTYPELQNDNIIEIYEMEEDTNLLKEKEEFLQLFEKFCGFSLPDYFIFPKAKNIETDFNHVWITDEEINVDICFIAEKEDFLYMANYLRNDDSWLGYDPKRRPYTNGDERSCSFRKKVYTNIQGHYNLVGIDFYYSKNEDLYMVEVGATLVRN